MSYFNEVTNMENQVGYENPISIRTFKPEGYDFLGALFIHSDNILKREEKETHFTVQECERVFREAVNATQLPWDLGAELAYKYIRTYAHGNFIKIDKEVEVKDNIEFIHYRYYFPMKDITGFIFKCTKSKEGYREAKNFPELNGNKRFHLPGRYYKKFEGLYRFTPENWIQIRDSIRNKKEIHIIIS